MLRRISTSLKKSKNKSEQVFFCKLFVEAVWINVMCFRYEDLIKEEKIVTQEVQALDKKFELWSLQKNLTENTSWFQYYMITF